MLGGVNVLCPQVNAYIQNESMNEMGFFSKVWILFFLRSEKIISSTYKSAIKVTKHTCIIMHNNSSFRSAFLAQMIEEL